jgi:hypothetical protein
LVARVKKVEAVTRLFTFEHESKAKVSKKHSKCRVMPATLGNEAKPGTALAKTIRGMHHPAALLKRAGVVRRGGGRGGVLHPLLRCFTRCSRMAVLRNIVKKRSSRQDQLPPVAEEYTCSTKQAKPRN